MNCLTCRRNIPTLKVTEKERKDTEIMNKIYSTIRSKSKLDNMIKADYNLNLYHSNHT